MLDMFVFAVILVTVQVLAGLVLMRFVMTDYFVKKYLKFMKKYMNRILEMEEGEEL